MKWHYAVDALYYTDGLVKDQNLLVCPTREELLEKLRKRESFSVLAPYLPPSDLRDLFVVKELENMHGIFTTQEMEWLKGLSGEERLREEKRLMEEKLGLRIYKPSLDGRKLIGLRNIKRFIMQVKEVEDRALRVKAVFLVGIPGTGKSFSAKYASALLGYNLVELNLSKIIESPNPVFFLHSIFSYLERLSQRGDHFILWIDEIEKSFAGGTDAEKRVLGQLLTILNDMNSPTGYQINGIFWVTANDISAIAERNPEFLRKGRFDELFFVDAPLEEDARELFGLYRQYYGGFSYINTEEGRDSFEQDAVLFTRAFIYSRESGETGSVEASRFIYVPSEIEQICKALAYRKVLNSKFRQGEDLTELLYPYAVLQREGFVQYLRSRFGLKAVSHAELGRLHSKLLSSVQADITELDLLAVISHFEPLAVSLKGTLSKIRSNEKFFVKAD